jgi:hypothetical protein
MIWAKDDLSTRIVTEMSRKNSSLPLEIFIKGCPRDRSDNMNSWDRNFILYDKVKGALEYGGVIPIQSDDHLCGYLDPVLS